MLPELAITGYPPEDLLLRPSFSRRARRAVEELAADRSPGVIVVGYPDHDGDCRNAAAVIADGRIQAVYHKRFLPNYGVFDEARYFAAGVEPGIISALGLRIGLTICEDIWTPAPTCGDMQRAGVDLVLTLSASPYHRGKGDPRERMLATRARDISAPLAFCNLVGGQDELVFDGRSVVLDPTGAVVARGPQFAEALVVADLDVEAGRARRLNVPISRTLNGTAAEPIAVSAEAPEPAGDPTPAIAPLAGPAEVWGALERGVRDYITKNRFDGVVIGLSGGIDSALTAAIATDALGPGRVLGVAMPSRYSSPESLADAQSLAELQGIRLIDIAVDVVVQSFEDALAEEFADRPPDVTEENLQARARGTLLMALSNKSGRLVLATGNKSEMSVGYSTLYGDMVGGFAPLRDVSKTWVYLLSEWRNAQPGGPMIPENSIRRAPSAELRPDQLDTDSLPPYDELDPILEAYVENNRDPEDIIAAGADAELVRAVVGMVDRAEYKRRQGPIGIKITPRAFGRDRRMPITSRHA